MVTSIQAMAGLDWPVPDFSTLSRRQKTLAVQITHRRGAGSLNLLVDSIGDQVPGVKRDRGASGAAQAR